MIAGWLPLFETLSNYANFFFISIRSKDIIGIFIVLELKIQILDNLVSSLHPFLIGLYLNIHFSLQIYKLFDFG